VHPSPSASPLTPPESSLLRLARDLDRWGALFLDVARTREDPAVEQVLGGLVEWMGSDLLDGWLRLPIPLFEEVSSLAEELLRVCQAYLAWLRQVPRPVPAEDRRTHEDRIRSVLDRVHALAAAGGGRAGGERARS
jgi:hypothetical protein